MSHAVALAMSGLVLTCIACTPKAPIQSAMLPVQAEPTVLVEQRDAAGRLLYVELDTDGDDRADVAHTHRYDDVGNLIASAVDHGADGTFDATRFATWDAHGELIEEVYDLDGDGITDYTHQGPAYDAVADGG